MIQDRDPGDETDHEPPQASPELEAKAAALLDLIGSWASVSQRTLEAAQRQHHQERLRTAA